MSYIQLVSPDLSVSGRLAWCLEYAAKVFHNPNVAPNAWTAWGQTQLKHLDSNLPSDVAVPMWYSYTQNGINYGHVTINVPGQGIYSSPYKTATGHNVLASIAEVERLYGVKYVGWSEDILNVKVIKGATMNINQDQLNKICWLATGLQASTNVNFQNNLDNPLDTVLDNFMGYTETKSLHLDAEAYRAGQTGPTPTVLKPGNYTVK